MYVPLDILKIVASYVIKPNMKLLDWINKKKLKWDWLSTNPNAIHLLEQNKDKINWENLSENPNAIHILEQNKNKISWKHFMENPNIFECVKKQLKIKIGKKAIHIDNIISY